MNSFATAKLVNLETQEDHVDEIYILGRPKANFSKDVADRVIKFKIGVRIPVQGSNLSAREDEGPPHRGTLPGPSGLTLSGEESMLKEG